MSFFRSSFSRLPKHKRFEYKPLYYDKDKDEVKDVRIDIKKAHAEGPSGKSPFSAKYGMYSREEYREMRRRSRIRKMVLLMAMFAVIYLIFGYGVNVFAGLFMILVLLVIFIREVNKN